MRVPRVAVALVVPVGLAVLGALLGSACGETAEQKELRAYCDWLEDLEPRQAAVLRPIEADRGTLEGFAAALPGLVDSANLPQLFQGARAVQGPLARIRDGVRSAHEALRREVDTHTIAADSIRKVHARLERVVEVRDRAIAALAQVADRVDALVALEKEKDDPGREEEIQRLWKSVNDTLAAYGKAFDETERTLAPRREKIRSLLEGDAAPVAAARAEVDAILGAEGGMTSELHNRLGAAAQQGIPAIAPILEVLERRFLADYEKLARRAEGLAVPEGEAKAVWGEIAPALGARLDALRALARCRPEVERFGALAQQTVGLRVVQQVEQVQRLFPAAAQDLEEAGLGYQRFTEEVRRLRAEVL